MTALAPPGARIATPPRSRRAERRPRRGWRCRRWSFFVGFGVIPLVGVLALSFTTWDGLGDIHAVRARQLAAVLADPGLPHALWVTFLVMALSWLVQTPMSILLGVFLAGQQRYRAVLAVLYFIPLLLSSAAIAITYKALLDPNFGLGAGLGIPLLAPGLARRARTSRSASSSSSSPGSSSRSTR